jgi:hypothetical protein
VPPDFKLQITVADFPFAARQNPSVAPSPQKATAILTFLERPVSLLISEVVAVPSKNLIVSPIVFGHGVRL